MTAKQGWNFVQRKLPDLFTGRRLIEEGKFPNFTKVGDGWLIPENDVMALYEAGGQNPPKRRQGMISHGVE